MPKPEMSARASAIFMRTYSRPLDDTEQSFESFEQVLDRVIAHQRWLWERAQGRSLDTFQEAELDELLGRFLQRKVWPAGRTLWLGGTEVARDRELCQFNCSGMLVKTVYDMVDFLWLLLNGCGVGGKPEMGNLNGFMQPIDDIRVIRSERTDKGGEEHNTETWAQDTRTWTVRIGDSGEAWAKAVGKLMAGKYPAETLVLDFSQLRPEGSRLSRYGWKSAGDTVISAEFPKIARIMSKRAGQLLRKLDILDIINHLGVIQTGRRGAEIGLLDDDDPELEDFMRFKEGCYSDPALHHRQQSNNSILFWHKPDRPRLEDIFKTILASGGNEPGFINAAAARLRAPWFDTANPCVEILLPDKGFCNLFTVDVSKFTHMDNLLRALFLAGRANYRQTLVNLEDGVLQRTWHENNEFLHLCGVSLTGLAGRPDLSAHDLRQMRSAAVQGAWSMAEELGKPRPKNVTCIKPEGTATKVMDAPGEGAHKPLGRYVFNNVIFQRSEPMVGPLRAAGYEVRPHPTQEVMVLVKFPVENTGVVFEDFNGTPVNLEPAVEQLDRYKLLMDHYVDQNCSLTVNYDPEEVPAIVDWLLANWDSYVGVSWAFRTDPTKTAEDFGAAYLPQEVVDRETFEAYVVELRPIDFSSITGGAVALDQLDADCTSGLCPVR
jgi:adenosylcobalamin-dependent ribonucleoside-triphosphate reductase